MAQDKPASPVPKDQVIFQIEGKNARTTGAFRAQGKFEVRWTARGSTFLVRLLDDEDTILDSSDLQTRGDVKPKVGKLVNRGPGLFKLSIEATGPWRVRVLKAQ
ncbi:MAG: hypothetical protein JJ899_02245 [Alphaproteobacteria bacterium]|nr:hypothetical protein [Alphaproteobacteria bacterium]